MLIPIFEIVENTMQITSSLSNRVPVRSLSNQVPVVCIRTDAGSEIVAPAEILNTVNQFRSTGVQIRLSGHLKLSETMEFEGFTNLQIIGYGRAIIEQQHRYNDASPLALRNCQSISISDLTLLGTGTTEDDIPQQNALRIIQSRYVWVERCEFGPLAGQGTIKHGVHISDDSHWVWIRANRFYRITGCGIL